MAGVFIVRDLLMVPEGFDIKYSSKEKTLTPWMQFLWHMDREATKKMPELGESGKAVDLWFLGVHPDYRGNKIANSLVKGVLPLCKQKGFKYATIEATSSRLKQLNIIILKKCIVSKLKTGCGKINLFI